MTAAWLIRATKEIVQSAGPREMEARYGGTWVDAQGGAVTNALGIWQPELAAVEGLDRKYWKLDKDSVLPMDAAERDAVDAAEKQARVAVQAGTIDRELVAAILEIVGAPGKTADDVIAKYAEKLAVKDG